MTLSPDQIREKFIQAQEPAVVQWYVDRVMEEVHAHPDDAHVTLRFDVPEEDERPEFLEHLLKLACPQLKSAVRPLGRTEVFHLPESERKGFKKKIVAYVVWVR